MIDASALRALGSRADGSVVTSFYLDVDGRRYPRPSDYEARVKLLLQSARKRAEGGGEAAAVEADVERIRHYLDDELHRGATRGLAIFAGAGSGLFEAIELPVPVRDQVFVGPTPDLAQLSEVVLKARPVILVITEAAHPRLIRIELGGIGERRLEPEPAERKADTDVELGSFEPRAEEQAQRHYRQLARAVTAEVDRVPAAHVVLAGTPEATAAVERYLPARVAVLVRGHLRLPAQLRAEAAAAEAAEVVRAYERARRLDWLAELREQLAEEQAAVSGLEATLEALAENRVVTLFVEEGFESGGGRCAACGRLTTQTGSCPRCGAAVTSLDNVVDLAVTQAFMDHVPLEFCQQGELAGLGRIAAAERR